MSNKKHSEDYSSSQSSLTNTLGATKNTKGPTKLESNLKILLGMDRYITITKRKSSCMASTLKLNPIPLKINTVNQNQFAILVKQDSENASFAVKSYNPPPLYLREATTNILYINETHLPLIPDEAIQSLSESDMLKVEKRMERRRKLLSEKCLELGLDVVGTDSWHKPNPWEFLVNKKHHIIWCNVFKAASSSWMFNFNVLAGYSADFLHKTKEILLHLARERYPRVTLDELHAAQNNSITFIIARHPFERLLSAYRDKFVYAIPHSFHDKLGRKIVRTYRKKSQLLKPPKYPTFSEFVRWLLDQIKHGNHLDMHFVASTQFCTPCLINFDIILKFETLEEDQLYLIEKTGLKRIIAPEWRNMGKGKNTLELLQQFYSKLSKNELDGLYDYYKYDFELFNYSATSYFNIAKAKELDIPEEAVMVLGRHLT